MPIITEERQIESTVTVRAECDSCGKIVYPVFPGVVWDDQFEDALLITLEGGYGMFFDAPPKKIVLCKSCAENLIKTFPCFAV